MCVMCGHVFISYWRPNVPISIRISDSFEETNVGTFVRSAEVNSFFKKQKNKNAAFIKKQISQRAKRFPLGCVDGGCG